MTSSRALFRSRQAKTFLNLFFIGLIAWVIATAASRESALETSLYDFQQRVRISLTTPPTLPPELLVAAVDSDAHDAGVRIGDLGEFVEYLSPHAYDVTEHALENYLQTDSDGLLRSIRLYDPQTGELSPPLTQVLAFQGVDSDLVRIESRKISLPDGRIINTDAEGRIYPLFPLNDYYSYASAHGLLANLLHPENGKELLTFRTLTPISVLDLGRHAIDTSQKLKLLGMYLPEADQLEFVTPGGDMVGLELYSVIVSTLLQGSYLHPLAWWQTTLLSVFFIALLAALLQRRTTSGAVVGFLFWTLGWMAVQQALLLSLRFTLQSPVLLAGLAMLLMLVLQRSWRVNSFLSSLGGRAPLEKKGEEIVATILFTNLPETIKEWEESEPARAHAAREAHSRCVGYVVHSHGGRLVDLQGDSQMIAFGLEGGRHQQQATACAVDLVAKVNALLDHHAGEPSYAYCGLVTGPVATGRVGGGQYFGVAAIGDTTNSAARLLGQAKAAGKPILASVDTVSELGPRAELEEVGELSVKGRSQALKVWEVKSFFTPPQTQSSRSNSRSKTISIGVMLLVASFSTTLSSRLSHSDYLYNSSLDWVTPTSVSTPIIFAGLTEKSLDFHEWPWPRSLHAQVIENCREAGAKIIFLDFLFEDSTVPEEDARLTEAVLSTPQAIVAAAARTDGQGLPSEPKLLPALLESRQWGLINHAPGNGSEVLRYALSHLKSSESGAMMPGVTQKVVEIVGSPTPPEWGDVSGFAIRWGPKPKSVDYQRLLDPSDPVFQGMKGSIVVAGDNLPGRSDAFSTPYGTLKGAVIHALSVQTLLSGQTLHDVSNSPLLAFSCLAFSMAILWTSWRVFGVAGQCLLLLYSTGIGAVSLWGMAQLGYFLGSLPMTVAAVSTVCGWVISVADTNRALTNYIPRRLQERLETEGGIADLTAVGTVLLTDIRGYTTLSEGRAPSEILALLNHYHEKTAAIYQEFGGHLITYQGDAQIVVFGPLEPVPNPVLNAVKAASRLPQAVAEVAQKAGLESSQLRVGSGITTGEITLSLMGSEEQMQYSVFGLPVRRAHQLQSLSDSVDGAILLDPRSRFAVKEIIATVSHSNENGERFFSVAGEPSP